MSAPQPARTDRQSYIDWLRVGAMFLLVFYHTGRLFDYPGWHIKNADLSPVIEGFNRFLDIWHMPLFFLLAGASVWLALANRTPGAFTRERVLRILVPLIFGMLIIVPPQVYIQRIFEGDFSGSFFSWYPHTFQGTFSMDNPASGNLSWHHLWFLAYLFVFSLLLLPLFAYWHNPQRRPLMARLTELLGKPGWLLLPAVPLILVDVTLRPIYGYGNQNLIADWANFLFYILVFFYGFWLVSSSRMLEIIRENRYRALYTAIILILILFVLMVNFFGWPANILDTVYLFLHGPTCWCWLIAIFGIGRELLNFSNRVLRYASDAVLPVYILHQTLIVVFGYYVIQWNTGIAPKYFFIVFTVLAGSLIIYELVRRTGVTLFLFGIKTRKRAVPATQPQIN
jgi:glucans biosynthesis protein C